MTDDIIRVSGIELKARHGVLESEKHSDQTFRVDVEIHLDLMAARTSDELGDTVDYGDITQRVHDYAVENNFNLIERLADGLADLIFDEGRMSEVSITVHKPQAPIDVRFEDVSVTVHRRG